jgi:uncharacterized BrkB/YihY/UPF0761 family membrane protein
VQTHLATGGPGASPEKRDSRRSHLSDADYGGALLASVSFHFLTAAYALYLAQSGDLAPVYGPLGAVLGFLLVVYLGVAVILLGAELVAWSRPEESKAENRPS